MITALITIATIAAFLFVMKFILPKGNGTYTKLESNI